QHLFRGRGLAAHRAEHARPVQDCARQESLGPHGDGRGGRQRLGLPGEPARELHHRRQRRGRWRADEPDSVLDYPLFGSSRGLVMLWRVVPAFLVGAMVAACQTVSTAPPTPPTQALAPAPADLPAQYARFYGAWSGKWDNVWDVTL